MTSRADNSIRNAKYALIGQVAGILISIISRLIFVRTLSTDYLGLNSLFANILTFLSLADLGFGGAMSYALYKPIADRDTTKIKSLMQFYGRVYLSICLIVTALGFLTLPLYPLFLDQIPDIPNLDLIYLLFVVNTAASYFLAHKRLYLIANQNKHIDVVYKYGFYFILNVAQVICLITTKNYLLFLILQILSTILEGLFIARKTNKMYPHLKDKNVRPLSATDRAGIWKYIRTMFPHKFGGVILNATDNVVISKVLGLVQVGLYSNYYLITSALNTIIGQIFNSAVASLGNLNATSTRRKKTEIFYHIFFGNFAIFAFCCACLVSLINPFIEIWLGKEYVLSLFTVIVLTFNFYLFGMRRTAMAYREATGNYAKDWYSPLIEAIINIGVSVVLAQYFGIAGVFMGTIISSLCTNFWLEPLVVSRKTLSTGLAFYLKEHFKYTILTIIICAITFTATTAIPSGLTFAPILKGLTAVTIPLVIIIGLFHNNQHYLYFKNIFRRRLSARQNRKNRL